AALRRLTERQATPALLRGRAARLLLDEGELPEEDAERLMGLELSPGNPPAQAAGWVEGFLAGGGLLLVHDERLLGLLDAWLSAVPRDSFEDVLPLLRRTFTAFDSGVRRSVGELARRGPGRGTGTVAARGHFPGFGEEPDTARADAVLPVLRLLLGTPPATPSVTPFPTDRSTTTASSPAAAPAVAPIGASS
ncbi:DUF5682 family protein, partial [Streptomyces sp. SM12]|uniref:DUF5682 family protein n=1 Tax=Streptomyces sp. SM12 TaxID=1071602 RepID=UPI0021561F3A